MRIARITARAGLIAAAVFFLISLFLPCKLVNIRVGWSIGVEVAPIFATERVHEILLWTAVLASAGLVAASLPLRGWPASSTALLGLGTVAYHAARFRFWGSFVWGSADRVLYGYYVHLWACGVALAMALAVLAVEAAGMMTARRLRNGTDS